MAFLPEVLTEEEITAVLAQTKIIAGDLDWSEKPTNSAFLVAGANLLDTDGATIPGLTVELHYRRGSIAPDDCKYAFIIFLFKGGKKRRLYQIDVRPKDKSSHTGENGKWFGPHQHFGERAAPFKDDLGLDCPDHEKWFRFFLKLANIQFGGKYIPPERQRRLPYVV